MRQSDVVFQLLVRALTALERSQAPAESIKQMSKSIAVAPLDAMWVTDYGVR